MLATEYPVGVAAEIRVRDARQIRRQRRLGWRMCLVAGALLVGVGYGPDAARAGPCGVRKSDRGCFS